MDVGAFDDDLGWAVVAVGLRFSRVSAWQVISWA